MARGASMVQRELSVAHRQLVQATRYLTGADSDAVKGAASVLRAAIRRKLSVAASGRRTSMKTRRTYGGDPAAPGQAPHLQSGASRRSVKSGVVDGVRRVGTDRFVLRLQEFGVIADTKPARKSTTARTRRDGKVSALHISRHLVIEPRPSFEPALAEAMPKMRDVFVSELGQRVAKHVGKGA